MKKYAIGAYQHFGKQFEETLRKQNIKTTIHISDHMEDAAIIGSACMFDLAFCEKIKSFLSKM